MLTTIRHCIYERAYAWAGRWFGFFDAITKLQGEAAKMEETIEGMHSVYMEKYRELEALASTVTKAALPELRLKLVNYLINDSPSFEFYERGPLIMAHTEPHHQARFDEVNSRAVVTSDVKMGFAFADRSVGSLQSQVGSREYALALAFAKKAGEMAYDAVMNDLKFRPSNLFNPKP